MQEIKGKNLLDIIPELQNYSADPFNNEHYAGGNLRSVLADCHGYTVPPFYREHMGSAHVDMEYDTGGADDAESYIAKLEDEAEILARLEAGETLADSGDTEYFEEEDEEQVLVDEEEEETNNEV